MKAKQTKSNYSFESRIAAIEKKQNHLLKLLVNQNKINDELAKLSLTNTLDTVSIEKQVSVINKLINNIPKKQN